MSTTTARATASPAYQPRSFRTASPSQSSAHVATGGSSTRTLTPRIGMEHPLPSRPMSPLPPYQPPRLGADRIQPINQPSASGSGGEGQHPGVGDRKGSSLRNEVNLSAGSAPGSPRSRAVPPRRVSPLASKGSEVEEGEVREVSEEMKQKAKEVLKVRSTTIPVGNTPADPFSSYYHPFPPPSLDLCRQHSSQPHVRPPHPHQNHSQPTPVHSPHRHPPDRPLPHLLP